MGTRIGRGKLITTAEAETVLSIPVFYILHGRAKPVFPFTDVSSPSGFVLIIRTGDIPRRHISHFPTTVHWKQWQEAVVPVLQDDRWEARTPLFSRALQDGNIDHLLNLLTGAIRVSFDNAGYGLP